MDGSASTLIDRLRSTDRSVIFGTSSFWEGIDVPGEALSMLIIAKLPFPVPSDPIFQARGELLENSFMELAVPSAVLKFKQGFGRLIRRSSDRGVCAVLDRRIIAKRYGSHFLHSLPPTTKRICSRHDMAPLASMWLSDRPLPPVPEFMIDEYDPYEGAWR
jgi:DNA polymerase-3 subunit epsilon/ATP-dependent DNA helicase DinG